MVQHGHCNLKDHGREEAKFPFHFTYQAESNFQNIAQEMLSRETTKTSKTKENYVWESCCCVRDNDALRNSLCKCIFWHFTVQAEVQKLPRDSTAVN